MDDYLVDALTDTIMGILKRHQQQRLIDTRDMIEARLNGHVVEIDGDGYIIKTSEDDKKVLREGD